MSSDVISHSGARRKRAHAPALSEYGLVALFVAACAILFGSWLGSTMNPPAAPAPRTPPAAVEPALGTSLPETTTVDITTDLAGGQAPRRVRTAPRRTSVPLNANSLTAPDGYEILSAAELDGISQAHE